jgi:murein DD-endopeptidase MepM/ murein hydrolase activator NlpD
MGVVVALVSLLFGVFPTSAVAGDPTSDLEKVKSQIDLLEQEIESAKTQKSEVGRQVASAQKKLNGVLADLQAAQAALDEVENGIATQQSRLDTLQAQLAKLERQLAETRLAISNSQDDLELQVVQMYMDATTTAGATLLEFESASDLAVGIAYSSDVAGASDDIVKSFIALKSDEERQQGEVEDQHIKVEDALSALEVKRMDREKDLARVQELEDQASKDLAEVEAVLNRITANIAAAEEHKQGLEEESARLEEEIRKLQSGGGTNPGVLGWPASGPVTSPFGWRVHPIFGTRKLHTGIDISVPYGTEIHAAGDGTVILAGSYGGYGNAVVIDHGGGLSTLYGHQSKLAVNVGQRVSRGQVIGYVGCTGYCTGPHLHFETRENGVPVDPMKYLS